MEKRGVGGERGSSSTNHQSSSLSTYLTYKLSHRSCPSITMARRKQVTKKSAKELAASSSSDEEEEADSQTPEVEPIDSDEDASSDSEDEEEYDSEAANEEDDDDDDDDGASVEVSDDYDDSDDDEFEEQGSSDDEEDRLQRQHELEESDEDVEILDDIDVVDAPRSWSKAASASAPAGGKRSGDGKKVDATSAPDHDNNVNSAAAAAWMHTDNLSSDDEDDDGTMNRIGRIPLHWYDEYDHIGYDGQGKRVIKSKNSSAGKDLLDQVIDAADNNDADGGGKFTVYDALNARDVTLTPRQIELIRRLQGGAFAHPEHDANPDYIDYFSGVDPMKSGLNSDRYEKKSRFQPSKWEKLQVRRLLHRLKCGSINMDFLEGKVRDMNDLVKRGDGENNKPFQLWKGDEEDELALRKGPQHMPAPKVPPPGHALSYNPPGEYLPTEEELKEWEEMDPSDRPYGYFVPQKFDNLRSVGAYEHAVKERFERCLDLYLCPRAEKRRLNIDPESLVPQLPKASDLRPFPTTKCIEYCVPGRKQDDNVVVRCLSVSPDGQFLASGDEAGFVRLWEVQTGRLLKSWDLNTVISEEEVSVQSKNFWSSTEFIFSV